MQHSTDPIEGGSDDGEVVETVPSGTAATDYDEILDTVALAGTDDHEPLDDVVDKAAQAAEEDGLVGEPIASEGRHDASADPLDNDDGGRIGTRVDKQAGGQPPPVSHDTGPAAAELRAAYRIAVRTRAIEESIVRLVSRGEVRFAIWGPGEEVHGTATALALSKVVTTDTFGFVPHYRSTALLLMWCSLHNHDQFTLELMRQQFSRVTDMWSGGRNMVNHYEYQSLGILPLQSPVGMQLGKAAGWAQGLKLKGITDGVAMAIIGDGTTAENDLHEAMNAGSVWELPLIIMVADNNIAISTPPEDGRGIVDFESYACAFGFAHYACDGRDFWDCYETTEDAARFVRDNQRPVLVHVQNLPRFNGHSSAADVTFDLSQADPLIAFGDALVERGVLAEADILRRKAGEGRDFFSHHELGRIMTEELEMVRSIIKQVREEPEPDIDALYEFVRPPFPDVTEQQSSGQTAISYAGAIRAAVDNIVTNHGGVLWGQDVARLGGVMTATAGLHAKHPSRIIDTPINEPLIIGTAVGAGLHDDIVAMPEIQFSDYSFNSFHWLVYLGNLYWTSQGNSRTAVIVRMPTDPFGGGAPYHSMSVDGYFTPIPGLVIVMPSTSYDVYGLLMTAAEYRAPVVMLEPKWLYRLTLGPAFPGEPTDPEGIASLKKRTMRGEIPEIDPTLRVPFSRAARRRRGDDVTIVAWGRAVWTVMDAATELAEAGIEADVLDLRTLVPPDLGAVLESAERTGRLVVASEDRPFAGFARAIQGAVVEVHPGIPTRAIGQKNVPGIGQSAALEKATVLNVNDVVEAVHELMQVESKPSSAATPGWSWVPSRYYYG